MGKIQINGQVFKIDKNGAMSSNAATEVPMQRPPVKTDWASLGLIIGVLVAMVVGVVGLFVMPTISPLMGILILFYIYNC